MYCELSTAFISPAALRGLLVEVPERTAAIGRSGTSITAIMLSVFLPSVIMLRVIMLRVIILCVILPIVIIMRVIMLNLRRHDTEHNNIQYNDTHHNDIQKKDNQHKGLICHTQRNNTLSLC